MCNHTKADFITNVLFECIVVHSFIFFYSVHSTNIFSIYLIIYIYLMITVFEQYLFCLSDFGKITTTQVCSTHTVEPFRIKLTVYVEIILTDEFL